MTRRAFGLAELLVVMGILMLITALSYSPLANAIESYRRSACVSHLRQLHLAVSLYRIEAGGDGVYGDCYAMGLPPDDVRKQIPQFVTLRCASAGNDMFTKQGVHYYKFWLEPEVDGTTPTWAQYAEKYRGESVFIADMNHNSRAVPLMQGDLLSRLGLCIRENGSLARVKKPGDWMDKTWWN